MKLNPIQSLCSDDDYVRNELVEARRLMGLKSTNLDSVIFALGLLYLYCSDKMRDMVETTLNEASMRRAMVDSLLLNKWGKKNES